MSGFWWYGGEQAAAQLLSGPAAYSIDAQPGSFTVTGFAATVVAGRVVDSQPGSYVLTGFAATLARGFVLSADPGGYSFTGLAAALQAARLVNALPGVFRIPGSYAEQVLSDQPRAYYRLNEASGHPQDSSGYGNHVTATVGVVQGVDGLLESEPTDDAVSFDGAGDDYLTAPDHSSLDFTGQLSVEAWVNPVALSDGSGYNHVVGKYNGSNSGGFDLNVLNSGAVNFAVRGGGTGAETNSSAGDVPLGVRTHILATYDDASGDVFLYVNGVQASSANVAVSFAANDAYLSIGTRGDGTNPPTGLAWEGTIDEVAVYPTALSSSRALAHFNAGRASRAGVVVGRVLSSDPGTYVLTGNAATLLAARMLSGDPGSYAVAGAVAEVVAGRVLSSDPGVYVLTGVDATLLKVAAGAYSLTADPGSFSLSGVAAGVVAGRVLDATPGSYSLIGAAATLLADRVVQASPGAFVVTGVAAAAVADRLIAALPASYALSGLASGLVVDRVIQTSPGVYTVIGHDAGLVYSGGAVVVLKNLNLLRVGE